MHVKYSYRFLSSSLCFRHIEGRGSICLQSDFLLNRIKWKKKKKNEFIFANRFRIVKIGRRRLIRVHPTQPPFRDFTYVAPSAPFPLNIHACLSLLRACTSLPSWLVPPCSCLAPCSDSDTFHLPPLPLTHSHVSPSSGPVRGQSNLQKSREDQKHIWWRALPLVFFSACGPPL